jgi:hypothetical protein
MDVDGSIMANDIRRICCTIRRTKLVPLSLVMTHTFLYRPAVLGQMVGLHVMGVIQHPGF